MKKPLLKNIRHLLHVVNPWIMGGASIILITSALYMLLQPSLSFLPYIQSTDFQKVLLLFGELLAASITAHVYLEIKERTFSGWLELIFLFLFLNCVLLLPITSHYFDPIWKDFPGVRKYRSMLLSAVGILLPLTAAAALVSFRSFPRLRKLLESLLVRDRLENPARTGQGSFILWLKENWLRAVILILLVSAGIYLRGKEFTTYIMDDESHHLSAALELLRGSTIGDLEYRRSLYTVTLPLVLAFKLFSPTFTTAHWTAVFFNILAVLPLYLLVRRYSRNAALAAAAVFLLNPWMIATARLVREYAFVPFFLYLLALVMAALYDAFPENFAFPSDSGKILKPVFLIPLIFLLAFLAFVLLVDPHSTLKVSTAMYLSLALLLIRKLNLKHQQNLWLLILPAAAIVLFLLNINLLEGQYSGFTFSGFETYFFSLFFSQPLFLSDPIQQPNAGYGLSSIILIALSILSLQCLNSKRFSIPFAWLSFLITLFVFTVFTVPGQKPRFATYLLIWYIPMIASGLHAGYMLLRRCLKPSLIPAVGIFLLYFNLPHLSTIYLELVPYHIPGEGDDFFLNGTSPIINEYFSNPYPALDYLAENLEEEDTLITTTFLERFLNWNGFYPPTVTQYDYLQGNNREQILDGIRTADEGWIALDYERGYLWSSPLPLDEFDFAGRHVDWKGWKGDTNIYHWYIIE